MRRRDLGIAAVGALAVAVSIPQTATGASTTAARVPRAGAAGSTATVDMEALLRAAQIDPQRADQTPTDGARAGVLAVEQALWAEGLLATEYVDGHFGSMTVTAYADYQRSLGFSGIGANGLPGEASLTSLGEGRFDVTNVVVPGARRSHSGMPVNTRTRAMLAEAERRLGRALVLDQGSYSPGEDPTSAGTHDGGGAVDINVDDMDRAVRTATVRVLRELGFAAWLRDPSQDDWPYHIHAVAISDPDLSPPAQGQVGDYYLGRDGLAGDDPDDGPRVRPIRTWEEYRRTQ
ncbi:peptidoglycan-binding protein [Georgenia alba]|uniref:Peptidoglycan-binding protein n=1 Tax=Georgenia alba TaxID=2233858 RepID=A0ABW2Q6S7_9MICO